MSSLWEEVFVFWATQPASPTGSYSLTFWAATSCSRTALCNVGVFASQHVFVWKSCMVCVPHCRAAPARGLLLVAVIYFPGSADHTGEINRKPTTIKCIRFILAARASYRCFLSNKASSWWPWHRRSPWRKRCTDESGVSSGSGDRSPTLSEPRFYSLEVTSKKVQESLRVTSCFPVYFLVG